MYKLVAFDMDGTLLNSEKKISNKTVEAINKAIEAGKIVILNTGRCPAELKEYREMLPRIRPSLLHLCCCRRIERWRHRGARPYLIKNT